MLTGSGEPAAWPLAGRDAVERWHDLLSAIFDASSDGLLLYDDQRRIVAANPAVAELLQVEPSRLASGPSSLVEMDVAARCERPESFHESMAAHFTVGGRHQNRLVLLRPRPRVIRTTSTPFGIDGGRVGRLFTFTDMTAETELEKMREEFVSMASHELRTPLTSIHGALQLALAGSGELLRDEDREMLEISVRSTERLARLVDDLLDLSKLEAVPAPPTFGTVDVLPLVDEAGRAMQPMAIGRSVKLVTACQEGLPPVDANRDGLARVLANLLANALRFSPPGERVTLAARRVGDMVEFSVTDHGPGISPDQGDKLFKPFSRVGVEERQQTGGTGLGLAICRAIVLQHRGRIWVEQAVPHGSHFVFVIPAAAPVERGHGQPGGPGQ